MVKGIQFLHTGIVPRVFSSNLKIIDVLLDQNFVAKLSYYDLPLSDQKIKKDGVQIYFNKFKEPNRARTDYWETVCTQKEIEFVTEQFQTRMTANDGAIKYIGDPEIHNTCADPSLTTMVEIYSSCLVNDPAERPPVEDMLWNLLYKFRMPGIVVKDFRFYFHNLQSWSISIIFGTYQNDQNEISF